MYIYIYILHKYILKYFLLKFIENLLYALYLFIYIYMYCVYEYPENIQCQCIIDQFYLKKNLHNRIKIFIRLLHS